MERGTCTVQQRTLSVKRQVAFNVSNQMNSEGSEEELRNKPSHIVWGMRAVKGGRNSSRRDLAAK